MSVPKLSSYEYGEAYQQQQVEKYLNRENNHWKLRIELVQRLTREYALPRLKDKPKQNIVVVDVGCSIGTFAIEFAKQGYCSYGIDFDQSALEIARKLAREEEVLPEFICGDVSDWSVTFPKIDIAVCFDIFEHLHDDELGSLLASLRRQLSKEGCLIFHTYPSQYEFIFSARRAFIRYPLMPFKLLSPHKFNAVVQAYSCLIDIGFLLKSGITYKESIKRTSHCNPTTVARLSDILERLGYEILFFETANLYNFKRHIWNRFSNQPISYNNLYGVAIPG